MEKTIKKKLSFSELTVQIRQVGKDYQIVVSGGDKPHIGCVVMAVPRPSLTGDGSVKATSSVLNLTGHKDETLCRCLAEETAKKKNAVAVCTGGFHADHITLQQIREVTDAVMEIAKQI